MRFSTLSRTSTFIALGTLSLAGAAWAVHRQSVKAERSHPPRGSFHTHAGVRLHYIERGSGAPVLLLHGNGGMIDDMLISGVVDRVAASYRSIVVDRPGFGFSERPRGRTWRASEQAAILPAFLEALGVDRAIVVGHSWGTLVALALALDHPHLVDRLVLASGYYFPSARSEAPGAAMATAPLIGDAARHTVMPLIGKVVAPGMIAKMFAPQAVTPAFEREFPVALTLRPSQILAFAADTASMAASADELAPRYGEIRCPIHILAGTADRIVDIEAQSARLHRSIPHSTFDAVAGLGHMVHHIKPDRLVSAIGSRELLGSRRSVREARSLPPAQARRQSIKLSWNFRVP